VDVETLEEAFISYLEEAAGETAERTGTVPGKTDSVPPSTGESHPQPTASGGLFSLRRLVSYTQREGLELRRDPIRLTLALLGSAILMFVIGYGINMDVEDLSFAVLDRDQTVISRNYSLNLAGSRYFTERPPLKDYADLDRRMRAGEISLAIEIPPGFGRDLRRGTPVAVGAWIDGAMPTRAETVRGYVQGMHALWLAAIARQALGPGATAPPATIETRFRYNQDVKSLPAMVPAVIPLLLMMIPAMLTALSVVREKELGSIVNLYVTPVTRLEFLLGKQVPYVVLALVNFLLLTAMAIFLFRVPLKGSFITLGTAALLYVIIATAFGLLISTFHAQPDRRPLRHDAADHAAGDPGFRG